MVDFYNEILIKNIDCSLLYFQIKDDEVIKQYEELKKEKAELMKTENTKRLAEVQEQINELSKKIHTFKGKEIKFPNKDNRYRYSGSIADSLLNRKLREVVKEHNDNDAIRTVGNNDYTDVIINIKFKYDSMIPDGNKKCYNPETDSIVDLGTKKMKKLISKKKLRQMAYRDGITINGIHYVDFQRTSSKARTGNCLFIDERYFEEMDGWQNLGIPFREMIKSKDRKNPNPFEEADIVGIRSSQSLISSSIIGELDIDPYRIVLIDEVAGTYTMNCNVIKKDDSGKGLKVVEEPYTQSTDLWDGQSLLDSSVFKNGGYKSKNKDGVIEEHSYENYGFILLRNHFFKSAGFNTNLQSYYNERFKDVENPVITDTFGEDFPVDKVLMVTTRNSVKIFKYADIICEYKIEDSKKGKLHELEKPLNDIYEGLGNKQQKITTARRKLGKLTNLKNGIKENKQPPTEQEIEDAKEALRMAENDFNESYSSLEDEIKSLSKQVKLEQERLTWNWYREQIKGQKFGCCKTEHKSKFGDKQQIWYQVIGSLNFDKDKIWKLVETQITELNLMKKYVPWFRRGINIRASENIGNAMMLALLDKNENISRTKWFVNYRRTRLTSIINRLKAGKIQIKDSDFCTLVGNPYEMLRASCGDVIDTSILKDFECYCPRYENGEELFGMRSPHICTGNNALLKNTYRDEWKWFNLTDNILIINLWGKGSFLSCTWNGSDQDSDTAFIGNNPLILDEVKKVQNYLIPINGVPQDTKKYEFTEEEMAVVDGKLCNDLIGKVCNLARDLQALYWHLYNTGSEDNKKKYLPMIYDDICLFEVLSNIAIDSAKRKYDCNIASEMKRIKTRPYMTAMGAVIKDDTIIFADKVRYKKYLSDSTIEKYERAVEERKAAKTLAEIEEINERIDKILKVKKPDEYMVRPYFAKDLKSSPKKRRRKDSAVSDEQKEVNRQIQKAFALEQKELKEKIYRKLQNPMDLLNEIIGQNKERSDRTTYITFVDILNPIPSGVKADYNRIKAIKEACYEAKKAQDRIQSEYKAGKLSFDDFYEEKTNIQKDIVNNIKNREVTTWDINKLIRDAHDIHPQKDKHGKIVKDEKGKPVLNDKRDKELKDKKTGGLLLQWVYAAHPEKFLAAFREDTQKTVVRKYDPEKESNAKINSFKDLGKLFDEQEIFELDGEKYIIERRNVRKNRKAI